MASPSSHLAPRFHRRILGLGALATVVLLVIGAPFFNNRIEDDLERRVPTELAEAGFSGITATFSGQDGELRCLAPLEDPEQALAAAYDVWGVRTAEIDRSCRVNRAPIVETATTVATTDDDQVSGSSPPNDDDSDIVADDASDVVSAQTSISPDFDTVGDVVADSPQLSLLAVLIQEAGLATSSASRPISRSRCLPPPTGPSTPSRRMPWRCCGPTQNCCGQCFFTTPPSAR